MNDLGPRLLLCGTLAVGALACQESTTIPTAPSTLPADKVDVLAIACPASQTVWALNGVNAEVTYPAPTVTGGQAPVTSSCTPDSGTTLPIATTPARCTAEDELGQTARCNFTLQVVPAPRISATRFLAFGDSITAGVTSTEVTTILEISKSYPFKLSEMLAQRYPVQTIEVVNAGFPGEKATEGVGRIGSQIASVRPDVVLVMEGTNDVGSIDYDFGATSAALDAIVAEVRGRGIDAILATLPPIRAVTGKITAAAEIPRLNDAVRSIAFARGASLADVFGALTRSTCPSSAGASVFGFGSSRTSLATSIPCIGVDNIHPTATGYEVIAQEFLDVIVDRYDVSTTDAMVASAPSPLRGVQ